MTTLTDGRITLRSPLPSDAPAVAEAVQESLDALVPWMPWASADYDEAAALEWMGRGETSFVIRDRDGTCVGSCGLNGFDELNERANLGYWVRSGHTGQGIASAATVLVARHGLTDLGLARLEVIMSVDNDASRRVAERVGALHEGILRRRLLLHGVHHDAHSFSITSVSQLPWNERGAGG